MPDLVPVRQLCWMTKHVRKRLKSMYGRDERLCINSLPLYNIAPEDIRDSYMHSVEFMLAMLQEGAWVQDKDWQLYARYTVAKRLRVRARSVFIGVFADMQDTVMDYQLNGGTFKTRDSIRQTALMMLQHPQSTPALVAVSKLLLSLTDDISVNTVIQPFHWIRTIYGLSDTNPVFSMSLAQSEMLRQKATLCLMLRAKD